MADFIEDLVGQSENPASPRGLQRESQNRAREATQNRGDFIQNLVGADPRGNYAQDQAASWYTGANMEGTSNGWDTGFYNRAMEQEQQQLEAANKAQDGTKYFEWFDRKDATGVASWNDERRNIRVGDVYDNGKKVGNLYDQFDRYTANVMLAEMTLDGETKEKIFSDADRERWLDDEITKVTEENSSLLTGALMQKDFDQDVTERQAALLEGAGDEALTAGGAAGGLLLAGGAVAATGVGAVPGALIMGAGALVGGVSSWLNRDQLTEQTARAMEITERAGEKYGGMAALSTGLKEYSGVGLRFIAPASNLVQGLEDARLGKGGDGKAEFYEVDADGERKRSQWAQVADIGATLIDSVAQFTSPAGIGAYMAGTAGHVVGKSGQIATTGSVWDDRSADFNDLDGGKEWSAALGSVGIDVVQLGFAGAIAKAGAASRAAFATEAAAPGRFGAALQGAKEKLLPWTASAPGTTTKTLNGMKFTVDDATGQAVGARATWTLMAPSEALRWVPTTWRARSRAAAAGGAPTYDDFYRAAVELAGGSRMSAAIVNGWAEGGEEAVQAMLDPISVSADIDAGQVVEAYLYGAAAGAGMSLGRVSAPVENEQVEKWRAKSLYMRRNNEPNLSDEQWDEIYSGMSKGQRRRAATATPEEEAEVRRTLEVMQQAQTIDKTRTSSIGAMAYQDLVKSAWARDLANVNPNVDGSLVLMGLASDHVIAPDGQIEADLFPPNTGATTAWQAVDNVVRIHDGLLVQTEDLKRRVEQADAELAAATEEGVAEAIEAAQQKVDRLQVEIDDTVGLLGVSEQIRDRLVGMYEAFRDETDVDRAEAMIDEINGFLADAYNGRLTDETTNLLDEKVQEFARRAVELRMGRHPFIDAGSFVMLMPQVSKALTRAEAHGSVYTHQATLKALGGDHDGDFQVRLNTTYLPQEQLDSFRRGDQYLQPVDGGVEVIVDPPDGEKEFIGLMAEALSVRGSLNANLAQHQLTELALELHARYSGVVPDEQLVDILVTFEREVTEGNDKARVNLATALWNANTQGMQQAGEPFQPEMLWLMARINRAWDSFSKAYAANDAENQFTPASVETRQPVDRAYQLALAREEAATDAQTLSMLLGGTSPVRDSQHVHYSVYRAAVDVLGARESGFVSELTNDFIEMFAELGSGMTQSEMDRVQGRNSTQKRVVVWLERIAERAKAELGVNASEALLLIANTRVNDITILGPNHYEIAEGDVSLLQLFLKKSIEIDRNIHRKAPEDSDIVRKLNSLDRLTKRDAEDAGRSHTAQLALMEVFGHYPIHRLLGDSSKYLGPQLTLNQLLASVTNVSETTRNRTFHRWKRRAPYAMHASIGNPPYSAAEAASGTLHGYKVLVDAVVAAANKAPRQRERDDARATQDFINMQTWLRQMVQNFRELHSERLGKTSEIDVLRTMLDENPQLAGTIASIIPDAAKVGAFQRIDGKVYAAPWVEQMLVEPDAGKAAVSYIVNSRIAEWNAMGGNVDERATDPDTNEVEPHKHPRSYARIKSRFLQTMYHLAQQPDGFEFDRFLLTAKSAASPQDLMDKINSEPMWRGDRAPLLAFYDDVAAFEADPSEVWTANLPGTLQRENLRVAANRMSVMSQVMADYAAQVEAEKPLLANMRNNQNEGVKYRKLLEAAITNRRMFPDATGRGAREQLTAILQTGVLRMQDKGKADPAVAPFGESLVTMDEFGVKLSVFQELDALSTMDPEDIRSNLTKLVEGPVRIGLADGSTVLVDLSTADGALAALSNPATNAFAKAVLFPVTRDIDNNNVLQQYQDVSTLSLKGMLDEQTFSHLYSRTGRLSLEQAHRYISTIEAGVRKASLNGSEQEQQDGFYPIQQIINEFVVAYSHRPGAETRDQKKIRDDLFIDVAEALQSMSALTTSQQLAEVQALLKAKLRERFLRDSSALRELFRSNFDAAVVDVMLTDATAISYQRTAERIRAQLADPQLSDVERQALNDQLDRLGEQVTEYLDRMKPLESDDMVMSVMNMFTLTGDPRADLERKKEIRSILGARNRVGKFQGDYRLIDKVNLLLAEDPLAAIDSSKISDEEWNELGAWAATTYIAEMAGRSGSSVALTPIVLGKEGAQQRRFFDATWGYLLDGFLNQQTLKAARFLAQQAGYQPDISPDQVAGKLETGLFNEKKLGQWTDRVVYESLKARQVLSSASVGLAIPVAGDAPKDVADYVGAGWNLTQKPAPEMLTTASFPVQAVDAAGAIDLGLTDQQYLKLNNHFARSLVLNVPGAEPIDLMGEVGQEWWGDAEVRDSGYRVVAVDRLYRALEKYFLANPDAAADATVEIEYFDVDTKPYAREWANNVYFDGVGRSGATSTGPGPVAELVFAPGALSKTGQQNPLDMATKGGKGYKATPISPFSTTVSLESSGQSVAEILAAKAMHMYGKEYDTGYLLPGDSTALYKLMKQRHVVVGRDAEGEKVVWWAEQAIAAQAAGETLPTDAKLVALSDSQAQTLLGKAGDKGLANVSTMPVFNLADVDPFPSLDNERLAELGLTRLGEESTLLDSPFAGMAPLPQARWTEERGKATVSRYRQVIERFRGEQLEVRIKRSQVAKAGEQNFDIPRINEQNGKVLERMLSTEALAPVFARLGIPFPDLNDLAGLNISRVLKAKLEEAAKASPSQVIWWHRHSQSSDPVNGILGASALGEDFRDLGQIPPPTFEDIVVIDMGDLERASGGNLEEAYKQGKAVIREYARKGATVVLAATDGGIVLRNHLAAHLREGGEGYAAMAESPHFFAPINEDWRQNQTQRAMDSTLTEVQQFTAEAIVARHLSDRYGTGSSENQVHLDIREDTRRWQAVSLTLMPTQLMGTAGGHKFKYGVPVKGTGQLDQMSQVRDAMLALLRTDEGRKHLKKLAGGNPKGVPIYRENANGTIDPGVRDIDEALDVLQSTLEANRYPLERNSTIMMGDLIPVLGADNSILLIRVGFKLPNVVKLNKQLRTPFGANQATPGEVGGKVAIGSNELQSSWTVRPPFTITEVNNDPLVGLALTGKYDLSVLGKGVLESDGFKSGYAPMPNDLAAPDVAMAGNGLRVTEFGSRKSAESKAATVGQVKDFRWAFALSGIDFRTDLVEFFMGKKNRDEETFLNDWATVRSFLQQWANRKPGFSATEVAEMLDANTFLATMRTEINALGADAFGNGFTFKGSGQPFDRDTDPQHRLVQVILASLMAPRVQVDHVVSTSGMLSLESLDTSAQVTLMPQILTDSLNDVNYPELRNMLIDRVNARMPRNSAGQRIYELGYDWQFSIRMQNPQTGRDERMPGVLQLSLALPADENPVNYTQSSIRSDRKTESQHVGFVIAETAGGRVALERSLDNVDRLFSDEGIERFGNLEDGGFWTLLHAVPAAKDDPSYKPWHRQLPMQRLYAMEADKKVRRYMEPVLKNDETGWTQADLNRIMAKVDQFLSEQKLDKYGEDYRVEVDYLVREMFGIPAAAEGQPAEIGNISPKVYEQAVELMLTNVRKNLLPTYGGIIPLPHETYLALVYEAQVGESEPWAPKLTPGRKSKRASTWNEWVLASFGQMQESNSEFHSMFRTDLDGFMHTYQGTTEGFETMATSGDPTTNQKLMDLAVNQHIMSLDPNQDVLLADPIIFDSAKVTLDALVGYDPVVAAEFAREVPTSDLAKRIEYQAAWLAGKRMPKQKKAPLRSYLEEGARYQESSRDTHTFFHNLVNMSIIARLANPALWASAIIEVPVRNSLEHATNLLTGAHTGVGARAMSKAGSAMGFEMKYTEDDIRKINQLAESLGGSNEFLAEIYDELTYHSLVEVGRGKIGNVLERGASLAARATSDPRFGMLAKSVAKRYLEAAVEYLEYTDNSVTLDQLVAAMQTNPLYLKDNFSTERFNPHQAGLNRIAQVRSIKATTTSKMLMGTIDSLTRHPSFFWNGTGHLLKIPFLFTRFNANALQTMMGLGGFDQMAAMFLDSRKNPVLGRMKAAMTGVEYDPAEHDAIDMSDVLEGVDLMRPFIRGAVTHTGLMALGMMAGGLGLSGEDEEAKRRRRLAQYLGTPVYYDMREAQNDFRYADAIFLDSIPVLNNIFRDGSGRSAVMPHWIMRQFLSPVIGMERFFATGDLRQVKWGFAEAFSVIPTSVTRLWKEADQTADLLEEAAKDTEGVDNAEARASTTQLLLNIVGVYEKALIESSFVNAIRNGSDKYNRNPWVLPETNVSGEAVLDRMKNPQETKALQSFINEDGEVQQGYATREAGGIQGALTHQYAENNATAAVLLSLFTGQWGGDSSYMRQNMAPSTKTIELNTPSKAAAEALVLMAARGNGAAGPHLTADEIGRLLKKRDEAAGKWWDPDEIAAEAAKIYATMSDKKAALSLLDEDGREVVTKAGADGIFRGLRKGALELGDESLRGVFIPWEMRAEIEREWVAELIEEGMGLGLNQEEAKYRAKRIWFGGSFDNPDGEHGGLRGLLWSDKIPGNGTVKYNQLNTTYAIGPDGRPWATPFKRTNLLQALGMPLPHTTHDPAGKGGLTIDSRGNIVDNTLGGLRGDGTAFNGINTGLAALERVEESWEIKPPEPEELDDVFAKDYADKTDGDGDGSGYKKYGYTPWKRRSYGGGGGGGGGYFSKMYSMPRNISPYGNDMSFINTSNPILRRAFVRRERISSERGRLNQWQ